MIPNNDFISSEKLPKIIQDNRVNNRKKYTDKTKTNVSLINIPSPKENCHQLPTTNHTLNSTKINNGVNNQLINERQNEVANFSYALRGLPNDDGVFCYANSVVQAIFYFKSIRDLVEINPWDILSINLHAYTNTNEVFHTFNIRRNVSDGTADFSVPRQQCFADKKSF